jgi:hypothetical protein
MRKINDKELMRTRCWPIFLNVGARSALSTLSLFCWIVIRECSGLTVFAVDASTISHGSYFGEELLMKPEKVLWTRVLLQAVWDLAGIRVNAPPRDVPRLRSSARAWICSGDQSQGSFIWTCNSLSLDPDTVRRRVLNKSKEELKAISEKEFLAGSLQLTTW